MTEAHLSPTNLANYYHNQCHLYLHNVFHRRRRLTTQQAQQQQQRQQPQQVSALATAQYQRGLEWEANLFRSLESQELLVRLPPIATPDSDSPQQRQQQQQQAAHSPREIRTIFLNASKRLYNTGDAIYITGLVFQSPSFDHELDTHHAPRGSIAFGLAKPDLIKLTLNKPKETERNSGSEIIIWEVIDIKSSTVLKSSHTAQIGFYHLCLEIILASVEPKITSNNHHQLRLVPAKIATIWLRPPQSLDFITTATNTDTYSPVSTPTSLLLPPLRTFLFKTLPSILTAPKDHLEWHLNPACQGCEFFTECKAETIQGSKLGMIPNLNSIDAKFISETLEIARQLGIDIHHHSGRKPKSKATRDGQEEQGQGVSTSTVDIEDLDALIKGNGIDQVARTYAPTAKRFQRLLGVQRSGSYRWSPMLDAAITREPQLTKRRVFTFPRSEDVAVYISIILDAADPGSIGAFCISSLLKKKTQLPDYGRPPPSPSPDIEAFRKQLKLDQWKYMLHRTGNAPMFVSTMAEQIKRVQGEWQDFRIQVYTYSPAERLAIINHLIKAALRSTPRNEEEGHQKQGVYEGDIQLCLDTLCEGTATLKTLFQPHLLSGALLSFLSKKNTLSKAELVTCCKRLGLSAEGTADQLRTAIEKEQKVWAETGRRLNGVDGREVGQLGKVVVLKKEVERLFALPIPGFVDLPQTVEVLVTDRPVEKKLSCASDDVLFGAWSSANNGSGNGGVGGGCGIIDWETGLKARNKCMRAVVDNVRKRIADAGLTDKVLLNEAKKLEKGMSKLCVNDRLGKLFLMLQFDVVLRLDGLWQDRLDGCPNAPVLRYVGAEKKNGAWYQVFDIVSGTLEPRVEDRAFYDWILVPDTDPSKQDVVPSEIYFDDLSLCSLVFPLNRYTKSRWDEQHRIVKEEVTIANISDIRMSANSSTDGWVNIGRPHSQAVLQTFFTGKQLQKGTTYRISPRFVDFNFNRVLLNLVTMDFQPSRDVAFIELVTDPIGFAQSPSYCGQQEREEERKVVNKLRLLESRRVPHAKELILERSQQKAAERMMFKRLSVIWGPPGTGKTYTLALSTLRMIEVLGNRAPLICPSILVTAMTHAAIEAIVSKIRSLMDHYRALEGYDSSWLNMISLQRVWTGGLHALPPSSSKASKVNIYAGTTFQLYKYCDRADMKANLIIIDEAGQLALGTAALVIRWLDERGKLVLAGDHHQLAPIFATQYPVLEDVPLFGSVLDMLMHRKEEPLTVAISQSQEESQEQDVVEFEDVVVQLSENFRLTKDLGAFVETIYSRKFKAMNAPKQDIAESLQLWLGLSTSEDRVMEAARVFLLELANATLSGSGGVNSSLSPPRVNNSEDDADVEDEKAKEEGFGSASLALIRVSAPRASIIPYEAHVNAEARLAAALVHWLRESFGHEESIFVACPHRIQRSAVRQAILGAKADEEGDEDGEEMVMVDKSTTPKATSGDDVEDVVAQLAALHVSETGLRIDTVERLQGSEATFVIFLMSHTHTPSLNHHLAFLLTRRRLNVGISRAKSICIVVSSRGVLQPSLHALANEETRQGLQYLRDYEDRAWIGDIELEL